MVRGFLGGLVVGAVLSVLAVAMTSVVAGPPLPPEISADAPEGRQSPSVGDVSTAPERRLTEGDPERPAASDPGAPKTADGLTIADDTTRPAGRPDAAQAAPGVAGPVPAQEPDHVAGGRVDPIRPRSDAPAPGAPATDDRAMIAPEPPRPTGPGPSSPMLPGGQGGLQSPADSGAVDPVVPGADTSLAGIAGVPAPDAPGQPDLPLVSADTAPRPESAPPPLGLAPTAPAAPADAAAQAEVARDDTARPGAATAAPELAAPDPGLGLEEGIIAENLAGSDGTDNAPESRSDVDAAPRSNTAPTAGQGLDRPSIGTPATSLLGRGSSAADGTEDGSIDPDTAREADADEGSGALHRNAEPFDNPEGQPLMSVILMDTGSDIDEGPVGLAALGSFPYPLSFAIDTGLPDAAVRVARYRALGFEVMALVDLPENLTASDTEVALTALMGRLPEAVAVLEGPGTGLQGSPEMASQVGAILRESGHGIVWRPNGLGTAHRNAARGGVASRTLYRDFDSDDQSPIAIRRFLDQAALRAGQEGSVIVVGRVRADTISALVIWGLQDRVRRVVVAPVSAVLSEGEGS